MAPLLTEPAQREISNFLVDLCKRYQIPFFVFSAGVGTQQLKKQVVTFTGSPDTETPGLFHVEIDVQIYE